MIDHEHLWYFLEVIMRLTLQAATATMSGGITLGALIEIFA